MQNTPTIVEKWMNFNMISAKIKANMAQFVCSSCGYQSSSWYGRCPECEEWNTFKEFDQERGKKNKESIKKVALKSFAKIDKTDSIRQKTGIFEFDRVLGGGFIKGAVILLAGEPGVGKSTLILKALGGLKTVYISGEESGEQIRHRAERTKVNLDNFLFSDTIQVEGVIKSLAETKGKFYVLVVDSIQTVYSKNLATALGSQSQIKEAAAQLIEFAKKSQVILLLVGHITKGGDIAGPKMLEHMVDCVLYFEGEKVSPFRILRAFKNRFGPTDEVGVFEMKGAGLFEVKNPTAFLEDTVTSPGKAVVGVLEGSRTLFFEVQCLVVPTVLSVPRRVVSGFDYNKVQLILAVLRKNLRLPLDKFDVYINIVGGVSIKSTAADLGIAAAILSSIKNIALPKKSVFIGEVGLLGEVRKIFGEDKIIKEAGRFGFKQVYSSKQITIITELNMLFK